MNTKRLFFVIIAFYSTITFAQSTLPIPINIQAAYKHGTRSMSGEPGKNYWQNSAKYNIKVKFNPADRKLTGTVDIDYFNNSPDTLKEIYFKLYPNLFKHGVIRNMAVAEADETDGVNIGKIVFNKTDLEAKQWEIKGTNMTVQVPAVLPKQNVRFSISYTYTLNKGSHIRTGQVDTGAFFISYFFPRITVYDDIDGWNEHPYKGYEEFYNDFSHFDAEITVPGDYQVWATGTLQNAEQVYNSKYVKRIENAGLTDSVTNIISPADLQRHDITVNRRTNTWKFKADSVTDMAFAISNHYLWQASSVVVNAKTGRRTRVDAVFNANHKDYFNVINYARKTVEAISYQFPKWPYPYPHETVFDGLDQMEYPMMVNDNPEEKPEDGIELTTHEIFHTMFPFYMGTNETKYGWMDEGWATIGEWTISHIIDDHITDLYGVGAYENSAGTEEDQSIMTLTTQLSGATMLTNTYSKPALGYLYVKDMLGNELFLKALHFYMQQWHGKHPMPFDFFNCMNIASGKNLDWFWKSWFFERGIPDQAISKVTTSHHKHHITIINVGTKPVPIDLMITFTDGSTQSLHHDISCWQNGNKSFIISFSSPKIIQKVVLGNGYDPDVNKLDNIYEVK